MNHIQVAVLNPGAVKDAEKTLVAAARLTQRGHKIKSLDDFIALYNNPYSEELVRLFCDLPHPTLQKFGTITIAIVGASRRFLAQITRHQNEVKFMSASLQYSDMTGRDDFVVPYSMLPDAERCQAYTASCREQLARYEEMVREHPGSHDDAAYLLPQGMRNTLLISATPYQWKHMIKQRICRRNSPETRYVMLLCWEALYQLSPAMFSVKLPCQARGCDEGKMSCKNPVGKEVGPTELIEQDFPVIYNHI